jgi:DNA-binding protein H-NS
VASPNIKKLSLDQLLALRAKVEKVISNKVALERRALETKLKRLNAFGNGRGNGKTHSLKGKKVPPKYRDRSGNTWAGRGAQPRWLTAALKKGKSLESFLIKK